MKWMKDATAGILVAGEGEELRQLSDPQGVIIDETGTLFVADTGNHRVMQCSHGSTKGTIVVGGTGKGNASYQLHSPIGLPFDRRGHLSRSASLYVDRCQSDEIPERKLIDRENSRVAFSSLLFCCLSFVFVWRPTLWMSDTSILGYYDDGGRKNCWNQFGANVCVGVLTLIVIVLSVLLIYLSHKHNLIPGLFSKKNTKAGKNQGKGQKQPSASNKNAYADPSYHNQYGGYHDPYGQHGDGDEEEEEYYEGGDSDHGDES